MITDAALAEATETAVSVVVPEAEPAVAGHRRRFDLAASWGVPAHLSVIYPFIPPSRVDDSLLERLGAAVREVPAWRVVAALPLG